MPSRPILTLTLCAGLAGCGSFNLNSLNPFTWWGDNDEEAFAVDAEGQFIDPRPLIGEVTQLVAERTPGGVIIRATGLPPSQGYWSAALIPANAELAPDANGVLAFDFRAFPPPVTPGAGTPRTREIVTGYFLSRQALAGIRTVEVRGERNTRSIRP